MDRNFIMIRLLGWIRLLNGLDHGMGWILDG